MLRIALIGRDWRVTLIRATIWVALIVIVREFVFLPIRVTGISMQPTYSDHTVNFINRLSYCMGEPQRGDVVAIQLNPDSPAQESFVDGLKVPAHAMLLKRIVGLPGETIEFSRGHILINGMLLQEPYEAGMRCDWNREPEKLEANQYFVVGDNRQMPEENHYFGRCKRSQIVGKVLL